MAKSSNSLIAFCLIFYYWLRGIILFFIPRRLRYKSVKGELVLITGGGSGLGRALATRFCKLGANVVIWDINKNGLEETVNIVKDLDTKTTISSYVCDITDRQAVYETAAKVRRDVGSVTILVNNAGVVNGKNLMEIPDEKIVQTFQVNAISHFWTVKAFLPDMMSKNCGHLVSIASVAGQAGTCQLSDYCASKFAAVGFEESIRMELLNANLTGIKSTIVLPYFINTGMFAGFKSPILPALEATTVADEIISGVLVEAEHVVIPRILYIVNSFKTFLPTKAFYKLYEALGGFEVMSEFTGRQNTNDNNNYVNNSRKAK